MSAKLVTGLFGGGPDLYVAKKQLSYPLYGADFDPLNHHFLLVGGGGGSSATGVPNRISLLDTSNRSEIKEVSDIELPPDEDSVVSLAIADSNSESLLAYAGINSSTKEQKAGKNEHFRSFRVSLPQKRRKEAKEVSHATEAVAATKPLARTEMFRAAAGGSKNECYQRVLRISPPVLQEVAEREGTEKMPEHRMKKRIATIASGLATQNEVISFAVEDVPSSTKVISRVTLEKQEASDVDLTMVDDAASSHALAYCTDNELFLQQLGSGKTARNSEPVSVYTTPTGPVGRSKIRAIRFLTSRYLLLLQNRVNRTGVELIVMKVSKDFAQVQHVLVKYLKHMKQAVGLDTCTLSKAEDGSQQFVVAIAGQDSSVQIFTIDWFPGTGISTFKIYADAVDVHSGPITRIVFSNFIPPKLPISKETPPQYIRLATVGVDKSVVVQTLPLRPSPAAGSGKTNPRYVLTETSNRTSMLPDLMMGILPLLIASILYTLLELRGIIPPVIGSSRYLPQQWQDQYGQSYGYAHDPPGPVIPQSLPDIQSVIDKIKLSEATPIIEQMEEIADRAKMAAATPVIEKLEEMQSSIPSMEEVQDKLGDLLSQKHTEDDHKDKAVVIHDLEHLGGEVSAELRREADLVKETTLKTWEKLTKQEQKTWKAKLQDAGHWTEKQGEAVLKGVFFGQLGALVGEFVRA